ncbi:DsbE family thiol:disulfide interchange protein [Dongia sedimenti]|uniref:DsbE family thiol:disulfide interchange protein n=1 Tax=Dongia sedimenti TaxID=3064282 RepID=A0ABU0YL90_9PROT|nr:DsbE family thiol:disulfide interchange protein [Rhodospirillaceae bacterium R-7]
MRRLLYALPILLLALFGWLAWRGLAPDRDPSALPSALIGKPVPQFDLPPLAADAAKLTAADVAGHVTVINFFASWCLPCKAEHPLLFELGKDYGVPVYGIAFKDRPADTAKYIQDMGSPYAKIGLDEGGRTGLDFGLMGVPETFILDKTGIVRYRLPMPLDADRMRNEIGPLLKSLQQ